MFTIEEYFKSRQDLLKETSELISLRAAFKMSYNRMNEDQQNAARGYLEIFNVSDENKTYIYDSRTIEERTKQAELNPETTS